MSVENLPSEFDETTAEPEDLTVRRLVRAIDYADGFWLGFAKSNTPAQRRRLAAICKDLLESLKIRVLEIELTEPVADLLPILRERLAQENAADNDTTMGEAPTTTTRLKLAIFVYGLEHSIPSREAYPPLLSSLNLKRELFRQEVPHQLLLWLPDYALTALARKAPDFWAWRSGLYEFAPERDAAEQSMEAVRSEALHAIESLSVQSKRERLIMLKGLLEDYRELGNSPREQEAQANILTEVGIVHGVLGEYAEAKKAFEETLVISRALKDEAIEASALHNLGRTALEQGEVKEAYRLYSESLRIKETLNNKSSIAVAIRALASVAIEQDDLDEAKALFRQALDTFAELEDRKNVAGTLYGLAFIAQKQSEMGEAWRLYTESLKAAKEVGDHIGVAHNLHQLGRLTEEEGDKEEATRLFNEALSIFERIGSPNAVTARRSLIRLSGHEDLSN